MLGMKARSKGIGFDFGSRTSLPAKICTDRSKLRQILINLIGNAIKFTDQGSVTISISACALGAPVSEKGIIKRRVRISFEVADTGKGISQDDLPKLFQKYSQTESGLRSSEGTGLGLPIAKSFIQLLGGDVKVESEYGKGTRFLFFIECDEVASLETKASEVSLSEAKAQKIRGFRRRDGEPSVRILIAEDQANNRFLLHKILGRVGFELLEAQNGKEAVEMSAQWKPHLILMDEDMPILKGSEAARKILSDQSAHPPVIISLTAYALEQARQKALEAGCRDFLAKPFKAQEIFAAISRHLNIDYVFEEPASPKAPVNAG
jgi:CheY-like chemotaxis protein